MAIILFEVKIIVLQIINKVSFFIMLGIISIGVLGAQDYLYFLQNDNIKLLLIKGIFINNITHCL